MVMRYRNVLCAATWLLALLCTMAHAEPVEVNLGGKILKLAPSPGACLYDPANPSDAHVLSMLEKGNQGYNTVVLAFSDCKDLEALRQGKRQMATGDYGQILSPLAAGKFAQYSRAEVVSSMTEYFRKNGDVFDAATSQKVRDTVGSVSNGAIKLEKPRMLGLLHTDPDFVQTGLIEAAEAGNRSIVIGGVITTTKIGMPITINLYRPYTDEASLQALAARAADYTRALIALNPETESGFAASQGRNRRETAWMALIGALAGGAVVIVLRAVKRRRKA